MPEGTFFDACPIHAISTATLKVFKNWNQVLISQWNVFAQTFWSSQRELRAALWKKSGLKES